MRRKGGKRKPFKKRGPEHKINDQIRVPNVRLTGNRPDNPDESFQGTVMPTKEAIELADSLDADLILINDKSSPAIVQICDYQKFLYNLKKRKKEQEANTKKTEIKELRLGPNTDDHDLEFKTKHAINWLNNGDKVKAIVFFRGRNIIHKDRGEIILLRLAAALEEYAVVENMPKLEGKRMHMFLKPKAKK